VARRWIPFQRPAPEPCLEDDLHRLSRGAGGLYVELVRWDRNKPSMDKGTPLDDVMSVLWLPGHGTPLGLLFVRLEASDEALALHAFASSSRREVPDPSRQTAHQRLAIWRAAHPTAIILRNQGC
jgi:hypothetical protein